GDVLRAEWLVSIKYLFFLILGVAMFMSGTPVTERSFDAPVTCVWATLVVVGALIALLGSPRVEWERGLEKWGATFLWVLMSVYAFAPISLLLAGDPDRIAYSSIAVLVSLLPFARALQLWSKKNA